MRKLLTILNAIIRSKTTWRSENTYGSIVVEA